MSDILKFPSKKREPLAAKNVELIGFVTKDDRDLFIDKPADIAKIIAFIQREKIIITEED